MGFQNSSPNNNKLFDNLDTNDLHVMRGCNPPLADFAINI